MSNKDELEKIRSQIDTIDESILELVNQRSLLAKETANLKKSTDIYKPEREAKIIRNLISLNDGPLLKEQVISILNAANQTGQLFGSPRESDTIGGIAKTTRTITGYESRGLAGSIWPRPRESRAGE